MRIDSILLLSAFFAISICSCRKQGVEGTAAAFLNDLETYDSTIAESWEKTLELFEERDFEGLEAKAREYKGRQSDPGDGLDDITRYFRALSYLGVGKGKSTRLSQEDSAKIFKQWMLEMPESPVAKIGYAGFLTDWAWEFRTDQSASKVSAGQFKAFEEKLQEATKVLVPIPEEQRAEYPFWFVKILTCARGLGVKEEVFDAMYADALEAAPLYVETHFTAAHFNMPQWGGKPGEWEASLATALEGMKKSDGFRVYAETIYRLHRRGHFNKYTQATVVDPANIKGSRIILGFGGIVNEYPDRVYYANALAHAKMAYTSDALGCRDALVAGGNLVDPRVWDSREFFDDTCGKWLHENLSVIEEY